MSYICFVECDMTQVPHMEPLAAGSAHEAREEARRLLIAHQSGVAAHVFLDDHRVLTVKREDAAR